MAATVYREQDLVRVMEVRPAAGGTFEHDDGRQKRQYDIGTSTIYVGYALKGTATSAASWTIKKIALTSGNPTSTTWTAEQAAIWDNRTIEAYT